MDVLLKACRVLVAVFCEPSITVIEHIELHPLRAVIQHLASKVVQKCALGDALHVGLQATCCKSLSKCYNLFIGLVSCHAEEQTTPPGCPRAH
jgi:hypothetical protein